MPKPITIIGGGLSGVVLGILLRREGIQVVIHEAGNYPRHKVCGEFISGRGIGVIDRLGFLPKLQLLGMRTARTLQVFANGEQSQVHELPKPALCISRYQLDQFLAQEFTSSGGTLETNSRIVREYDEPGVIRATGRIAERQEGEHVLGLKMHVTNLPVSAGLEMHFANRCYVGLCEVEHGRTNICGLFRVNSAPKGVCGHGLMIELAPEPLRSRIKNAMIQPESFCAVAALPLVPRVGSRGEFFAVGDSITMLPPATGNGMSFAFESASLAVPQLAQYANGTISWDEALNRHSRQLAMAFSFRVRWARLFHRALFTERARRVLFAVVRQNSLAVRLLSSLTR